MRRAAVARGHAAHDPRPRDGGGVAHGEEQGLVLGQRRSLDTHVAPNSDLGLRRAAERRARASVEPRERGMRSMLRHWAASLIGVSLSAAGTTRNRG